MKITKSALILAGHGSHISPDTAGIVWKHVDALREMGIADEITAAFWKEEPSFYRVLRTIAAEDVIIVPLFTAQGYFTRTVIPAEMGLDGALTQQNGRTIRYTRTLSEHSYLTQVVEQRIRDMLRDHQLDPAQTAVAVIGHSTRRNPESRKATEAQAEHLRQIGIAAEIQAVYLDDSPEIPEIFTLTSAPTLIAVPFFLAAGSHTTIDVPGELGLEPGQNQGVINGRQVYYTAPVGVDDMLREVIIELAREAAPTLNPSPIPIRSEGGTLMPLPSQRSALGERDRGWGAFPAVGRDELIAAVQAAGIMQFGQLQLSIERVQVWGDPNPKEKLTTPAQLRSRVRENPFRPLPTSTDLPGGWYVEITDPHMLHAVVETIYPGVVADWAAYHQGNLKINSLDEVAARQTGNYQALAGVHPAPLVEQICRHCVKEPIWFRDSACTIPCPEACNVWMSAALENKE